MRLQIRFQASGNIHSDPLLLSFLQEVCKLIFFKLTLTFTLVPFFFLVYNVFEPNKLALKILIKEL